jgi:catechol 2,3-dioxygenase-like lactoylglutathione lyase family enzyme
MIKKVDHATMVVKNLEEALKTFEEILHLTPAKGPMGSMPECRIAMLPTGGGARIELIEPNMAMDSRFSRFLKERGEGVFGLSIFIDNFDAEVKALREKGVAIEDDYQPNVHPGHPFRIAWVPPEEGHGVWIELVDWNALPDSVK